MYLLYGLYCILFLINKQKKNRRKQVHKNIRNNDVIKLRLIIVSHLIVNIQWRN